MKTFVSKSRKDAAVVTFELDGETYTFNGGKRAHVMMALLVPGKGPMKELDRTAQILDWFSNGLNEEHNAKHDNTVEGCQACKIQSRLMDPNDDLEFETVIEIATWLIGESATGDPTTA